MKKFIWLAFFVPVAFVVVWTISSVPSSSSAVTINDIPEIQRIAEQIVDKANQMHNFTRFVKSISDDGWTFTVPFSTMTLTLSNPQKQELVAKYTGMKAELRALVDSLPD